MGVRIDLTREEVFKAIFQYIRSEYPNMYAVNVTIDVSDNVVLGATCQGKFRKEIKGLGTRTVG